MSSKDNYNLLLDKLDQFTRKYYINQVIRGVLFTTGSVLLLFLAYNLLESEFYFNKSVRKVFFYSFNIFTLSALIYWIGLPLMHYFNLGKTISHEQAAKIIGSHFTDVKDRLLNILQLRSQSGSAADQAQLIEASIQQKSAQIQLVPFKNAIDLSKNKKHLRFALPPLLVLLAILVGAPSLIKDSAARIIRNNEEFEKAAPFHFKLEEEKPSVVQFGNYTLDMTVDGTILPNEVFIEVDQYPYRMTKVDGTHYTYTFNNVQKNTAFKMYSGEVNSKPYELSVLKKPNLSNFSIRLDYPGYIGRKAEVIQNIGDVLVPQGTKLSWQIDAENTDQVQMSFGSAMPSIITQSGNQYYTHQHRAIQDLNYKIYISNASIPEPDSIQYQLRVVADQYPTIQVEQFQDSASENRLIYFAGNGSDDYGLSKLQFHYAIVHPNGQQETPTPQLIPVTAGNKATFQHQWDTRELNLQPGDQLHYFFELFDNDGVHGPKSIKSNVLQLKLASKEELEAQNSKNNDAIRDELKQALEQSRSLQEQMNQLREKMIQEKKANWQDKKELEKLLEKQKEIQQKIEDAKKRFQENLKNQEKIEQTNENILNKQAQIEKMFEQLQDPKMQELMEKIQELMQQMEKEQTLPMMDEMKMESKEMEKQLDRMMELFKTLEVEHEMEKAIDKLREMAEKQDKLSEETKKKDEELKKEQDQNKGESEKDKQNKDQQNKDQKQADPNKDQQNKDQQNKDQKQADPNKDQQNKDQQNKDQQQADQNKKDEQKNDKTPSQEELKKQQEELNKQMEKLQEELKELEKKNAELDRPKNMDNPQEKSEDIKQDMKNSSQQMEQKQNNKASKSQKSAANKMKDMAQQMENNKQQQEKEQHEEDAAALRQLLENLVTMSFDQENLIKDASNTLVNTPHYNEIMQQQFKLKDDFTLIEDSLQALSKRVFELESFVTEKVSEIKIQMASAIEELEERNKPKAGDHQQRTMKNVNDLALMLSESLDNMQQQQSGQACANPKKSGKGEGQKPMDKISEGQKGMKEQLEQMKKGMEQGQGAGSKEFAKAAARQAALREALKQMQKEQQQRGEKTQDLQKIIDGMDKIETDLVNKKLTNEMMQRQNEILTRLLEAENADRERKQDEKRKSETGTELERKLPPSLQEYLKKREAEVDLYKTVSPDVSPYYRSLVEEYLKSLRTDHATTKSK